jgi:hypothetical protein
MYAPSQPVDTLLYTCAGVVFHVMRAGSELQMPHKENI